MTTSAGPDHPDDSSDPVEQALVLHHRLGGAAAGEATIPPGLRPGSGLALTLPEPVTELPTPLTSALWERRSAYHYARRPVDLGALSSLLRLAVGVSRRIEAYGSADHPLGMAPSAGGLRSLTAYLVVTSADGLVPGVYAYDAPAHAVREILTGDPREALRAAYVQPEFADRAPVTIALAAHLDRTLAKYPLRHYRTLHVDAGIAVQNLYLVASALDLSCCAVAGFHDGAAACLLRLPRQVLPLMFFPVGHRVI